MFEPSDLIHSYTRAQAIEDGVLVDVSDVAKEAGFKLPVAITHAAWSRYVEVPTGLEIRVSRWTVGFGTFFSCSTWRSSGRAATRPRSITNSWWPCPMWATGSPTKRLRMIDRALTRSTHRLVTLKALCGPGDNLEPVVTILLPNED